MRNAVSAVFLSVPLSAVAAAQQPLLPASPGSQQSRPDGELVYKQHCARCHDGTLPRMPTREALRATAPEHIESALTSFSMRRQAASLSAAERRAVAEFLSGRPVGSYRAPLEVIPKSAYCEGGGRGGGDWSAGPAWNGWGADVRNTRYQSAEAAGLSATDVTRLKLKWAFGFPGVSASGSQATIAGGRVFVGSRNGMVYALDSRTGCLAWTFEAEAGVRSTSVVASAGDGTSPAVYFGDAHAQVYGLDAATGALRWKVKVDDHPDAMITGGVAFHSGHLYVPVSSLEEGTAIVPTYECCTFRGSVVALDARTGRQIWKTYTIDERPHRTQKNAVGTQLWAPSGAGVWSTPAIDADRNRLYVTTGDSYSNPAASGSDAIMALAMDTGRVLWVQQTLAGDSWNTGCFEASGRGRANCPDRAGPDHDFGSSPALTTLADGRRVLLAGQKSGMMYGLNPDTGTMMWKTQAGDGGVLGGIEWGFATDGVNAYASLSNAMEKKAGEAGGLVALRIENGEKRWVAPPMPASVCNERKGCSTAQPAAVTAIPGAVFSGSLDGHLRAYDTSTGRVIWDVDTAHEFQTVNGVAARGGSLNGPGATVAGGMLFVSSGYSSLGFMPGNVLLAFSVEGALSSSNEVSTSSNEVPSTSNETGPDAVTGAYRPGNGVTSPRLLEDVRPTYPSDAVRAKIQGRVTLECVVRLDGTVGDVRVIRSLDSTFGLDQAAIKAAKLWRFVPGTRNGEPVPVLISIEMAFTLGHQGRRPPVRERDLQDGGSYSGAGGARGRHLQWPVRRTACRIVGHEHRL